MVLTFTGSLRVARAGRSQVHEMLIGALGCNLAWGLIDGIMYLMANLSERGHSFAIMKAVRSAHDPATANRIIADALPPIVVSVLPSTAFEDIRERLNQMPEPPEGSSLTRDDWRGAIGVFLLVFLSTFPVVNPLPPHPPGQAGAAHLRYGRHHDAVFHRVLLRPPRRKSSMELGAIDGAGGQRNGRADHRLRRMKTGATIVGEAL